MKRLLLIVYLCCLATFNYAMERGAGGDSQDQVMSDAEYTQARTQFYDDYLSDMTKFFGVKDMSANVPVLVKKGAAERRQMVADARVERLADIIRRKRLQRLLLEAQRRQDQIMTEALQDEDEAYRMNVYRDATH